MTTRLREICPGCGIEFQQERPDLPGYTAPGIRERRQGETLICRSCYRLSHYGEFLPRESWSDNDYQQVLNQALSLADAVFIIIDVVDFEGSWWPAIWSRIPSTVPVYFIGNKVDLLPSVTPAEEVQDWLQKQVQGDGRQAEEIILSSTKTGEGLDRLEEILKKYTAVAVIGATNTGKSSLIRELTKNVRDFPAEPVVSAFPGTTLGVIPVHLGREDRTLLDTPGLVPPGRLSDYYCSKCAPRFIPSKPITSLLHQLKPTQTLLFGGVAALTLEEVENADEAVVLCYFPKEVVVHKTKFPRISGVLEHSGDWLIPPCGECSVPGYSQWDQAQVSLGRNHDLAIAGLGWVSLRRCNAIFRLEVLPGTRFRTRGALVSPKEWSKNK